MNEATAIYRMNPHILICVQGPKKYDKQRGRYSDEADWLAFQDIYEKSGLTFAIHEQPAENVWLLDITTRLHVATQILTLLNNSRVSKQVFYLSDTPKQCE